MVAVEEGFLALMTMIAILESELVTNGTLILIGALTTFLGSLYKSKSESKKTKKDFEYKKYIFFIKLNHELSLFLESLNKSSVFLYELDEFDYYEDIVIKFLNYLEEVKDVKFDKKTTNFLYVLYYKQRSFKNDVFKYHEYIIDAESTPTGYPEIDEKIYFDRIKMNEYISEFEEINTRLNEKIFSNEK